MSRKQKTSIANNTDSVDAGVARSGEGPSAEVANILERVQQLLSENHCRRALEVIHGCRVASPWLVNATAVCHMRLGDLDRAIHLLRGLVLTNGIFGKSEAPVVFQTNFATALLLADNLPGCLTTLAEIRDEQHPLVKELRADIERWKESLSFWQRFNFKFGGQPARKIEIAAPGHVTAIG